MTCPADGGSIPATEPAEAADGGEAAEPAFWLPIEEVNWDGTPVRPTSDDVAVGKRLADRRAGALTRSPRGPLPGLVALVLLSLLSSFFAWVGAEPFWVAVGHARTGTVVLSGCTGAGLTLRCRGDFTPTGGGPVTYGVRVAGVAKEDRATGTPLPARMVSVRADTAYVDSGDLIRHLRWLLSLGLVLLCGAGIGWATGSLRLAGRWARWWAAAASFCGPVLVTLGFLAVTF